MTEQKEEKKLEQVTVRLFPKHAESSLKGWANVTVDAVGLGSIVLTKIRIIVGSNGTFLGMPSEKHKTEDKYYDMYYPVSRECRQNLTKLVLDVFKRKFPNILPSGENKPDESDEEVPF